MVYRSTASTRIRSSLPSAGGGHSWSPSHFAASCGDGSLSIIKEYIENQKRPDQRAGWPGGISPPDHPAD
ncbi:transposase [Microtetraspora malaysiensis]|uniref:transposase n=2 Tax=Microtetraspora malaysiensis TaxID=161358 RepID=UPI000A047565|nr:transposase [Microtetraspora malaysiensis]